MTHEWTMKTIRDRCEDEGECWIWQQSSKGGKYPQASINGKGGMAVRSFVFDRLLERQRPKKSVVCTSCSNTLCLNPAHLVWKTQARIVSESYRNGSRPPFQMGLKRRANAIRQGWAKITPQDAAQIRIDAATVKRSDLAARYGIGVSTVRAIVNGRIWKTGGLFNIGG